MNTTKLLIGIAIAIIALPFTILIVVWMVALQIAMRILTGLTVKEGE